MPQKTSQFWGDNLKPVKSLCLHSLAMLSWCLLAPLAIFREVLLLGLRALPGKQNSANLDYLRVM